MANILVFDSGVGGLSVYQEIQTLLPQHNYIYLFDNKAYPYGELEPQRLIERVSRFMRSMVEKHAIDLVVIACNTASTIVLPRLRQELKIPVVGVVPAIKPAAAISQKAIGLIATPATVVRSYTHNLIKEFAPNSKVELLGSTRLVTMAEEKLRGTAVNLVELQQILTPLLNQIDTAVLGCTHFPLLREEMQLVLGKGVTLIDSGKAIAERVKRLLDANMVDSSSRLSPYAIYSSATPWEGVALNIGLAKFGFSPVRTFPLPDA
ncbi:MULTISPECIES: glutamate racemase [Vibrio]|uniref:Glutamate racemase n=1 Tax=Vibrio algicola TaxID=2662262 RepID=A0A5Q0TA20_9VIBR|nr:glutamate racemase [Vibrio algicola]MBD1576462.1 glutamate racemase [Vibrio sp. S11_S32]